MRAGSSPLTCAGVVVDLVGGGPQVTDLPLAFHDAQLLLGRSRAGHPHGGAGLGLELQGGDGEGCLREAGGATIAVLSTGTATRAAPARPSHPAAAPPGLGSSSSGSRARCHPDPTGQACLGEQRVDRQRPRATAAAVPSRSAGHRRISLPSPTAALQSHNPGPPHQLGEEGVETLAGGSRGTRAPR